MNKKLTLCVTAIVGGLLGCAPAIAGHNGERPGITREGGHHDAPRARHRGNSHIVREGGHHHQPPRKHRHDGHWGAHHHHGIHLEGSH